MAYKKLSEATLVESVAEEATMLIEENDEIKRASVKDTMEKYGFSAGGSGGSGGSKKIVINADGNNVTFVNGSFAELLGSFDASEPIDVYVKMGDQYFCKVITISKWADTLQLSYYAELSYYTLDFNVTTGEVNQNRYVGDLDPSAY